MRVTRRPAIAFWLLWLHLAAPARAQSPGLHGFTPAVLSASSPAQVLFTVQVTGSPTQVVMQPGTGSAITLPVLLHDDGANGDATAGDGVYSALLPTSTILAANRADDVNRVFVGYLDLFNGATRVSRANIFVDVYTPDVGVWPTVQLAPTVQATARVANLVYPSAFPTPDLQLIAREFYRWLGDDYDFLNVVFSPEQFSNRYHFQVKNQVQGIGLSQFNNTNLYGSNGRLQGISVFPIAGLFDGAETAYLHEIGHQWIAYLNMLPLTPGIPHWPLSSMAGGVMGFSIGGQGGQGGNFTCDAVVQPNGTLLLNGRVNGPVFNDLDLYLMGLLPAASVRTQAVFTDQTQVPQCSGQVLTSGFTTLTAQTIVNQFGPRSPLTGATSYRAATILVTRDGLASPEMMALYSRFTERAEAQAPTAIHSGLQKAISMPFYVATGGRATLDTRLALPQPPPPSGFAVGAIAGNNVTFSWTPGAGGVVAPASYVIEGGLTPGSVLGSLPVPGTPTTYTAALPTGLFYVRLHALNGPTRSAASNEIQVAVNVPMPPSAPTNLLGLVNGNTLGLAWRNTATGGAPTSLLLDVTGAFTGTLPLPVSDTFSFGGVPPGTYSLAVRAANASGVSGPSNGVTLSFPGACSGPPLTPTTFALSKSGATVTASWDLAPSGPAPASFVVSVTGGFSGAIPASSRSLSGTVAPGTYTVQVRAVNACGTSVPTLPQTISVP